MKAMVFHQHGDESVLTLTDVPEPTPRANEVKVRVKAVALNHLDIWVRKGLPGLKLAMPHILGSDIAGVVEGVGSDVADVKPGTEVVINPGLSCGACERCLSGEDNLCRKYQIVGEHSAGGYAEYICVPRQNILPKPKRLSFEEAACVPLTFLTSWTMLVRRAQLKPAETILVQAAGSGVGSAAVQIAKMLGATVIATASTEAKLQRARELGADHVINYQEKDFVEEVKRLTEKRGVEVVFEHVGGETFEKSLACLPYGGRLVTCGTTTGHMANIDVRALFYKRISLLGSTMGSKGDLFRILALVEQGKLNPVLDRVLPLAQAAEAHRLMQNRAQFGNIALTP